MIVCEIHQKTVATHEIIVWQRLDGVIQPVILEHICVCYRCRERIDVASGRSKDVALDIRPIVMGIVQRGSN